jgi:hypothetical protein
LDKDEERERLILKNKLVKGMPKPACPVGRKSPEISRAFYSWGIASSASSIG